MARDRPERALSPVSVADEFHRQTTKQKQVVETRVVSSLAVLEQEVAALIGPEALRRFGPYQPAHVTAKNTKSWHTILSAWPPAKEHEVWVARVADACDFDPKSTIQYLNSAKQQHKQSIAALVSD